MAWQDVVADRAAGAAETVRGLTTRTLPRPQQQRLPRAPERPRIALARPKPLTPIKPPTEAKTTSFADFARREMIRRENVAVRAELARYGLANLPVPEDVTPEEENFLLERMIGSIRAEEEARARREAYSASGFGRFTDVRRPVLPQAMVEAAPAGPLRWLATGAREMSSPLALGTVAPFGAAATGISVPFIAGQQAIAENLPEELPPWARAATAVGTSALAAAATRRFPPQVTIPAAVGAGAVGYAFPEQTLAMGGGLAAAAATHGAIRTVPATGRAVTRGGSAVVEDIAAAQRGPLAQRGGVVLPGAEMPAVRPPVVPPKAPVAPAAAGPPRSPDLSKAPSGVRQALTQATAFRELDRPRFVGKALDRIPGASQLQKWVRPANEMPDHILTAWVAEGGEAAAYSVETMPSRHRILSQIDDVFGEGALDGAKTDIKYIGPAAEKVPFEGTVLDMAQRPSHYDLSQSQREFLRAYRARNEELFQGLVSRYEPDVGQFTLQDPEAVFLSNIEDLTDEALRMMGTTREAAALRGRGKTRIFQSAADRYLADPKYVPETNIKLIQSAMDEWQGMTAGREVFKRGINGLTRVEVVDATHPGLRAAKEQLAAKVESLRGKILTADRQARAATREAKVTTTRARQARTRAEPMLNRIDELGEEWGPELSHLSGQTRELLMAAEAAEKRGTLLTGRAVTAAGRGKSMLTELSELTPQLETVRKRYAAANLRGYQFVQEGIYRYFPAEEAQTVRQLQQVSNSSFVNALEAWRGTAFAGDFSPIAGVQVPIGALADPTLAAKRLVGAVKSSAEARDILYSFREQSLVDDILRDPQGYRDFAFYTGRVLRGTPREYAGGLLKYIPGFAKANEGMYSAVLKNSKGLYDKQLGILAEAGVAGDSAKAVAADLSSKVYPLWNPRRLGLSQGRAAAIRAAPTSVSFLTQPAALMSSASTGIMKLALRQTLTTQEQLAVRVMLTMSASVMTMSVTSAVLSALATGEDVWKAVERVSNPTSPQFISVMMGKRYIPLGGPFRGIIKAIAPRNVDWSPVPVPFAGALTFFRNRINPALSTQWDLIENRDWYYTTIRKGKFPEAALRTVLYELEGVAPLAVGEAIGGARRGEPAGETMENVAAQFAGTNLGRVNFIAELSKEWKPDTDPYFDISTDDAERVAKSQRFSRTQYRKLHPEVDAKLFILGRVKSLLTPRASAIATQLLIDSRVLNYQVDRDLLEAWGRELNLDRIREATDALPKQGTSEREASWNGIRGQLDSSLLKALERVWFDRGQLTDGERTRLTAIHNQFPLRESNFNAWVRQRLRQLHENVAVDRAAAGAVL